MLVLSSLACGGGGDIVSTGDNVQDSASQVEQVLDSSMLQDANQALLQALTNHFDNEYFIKSNFKS